METEGIVLQIIATIRIRVQPLGNIFSFDCRLFSILLEFCTLSAQNTISLVESRLLLRNVVFRTEMCKYLDICCFATPLSVGAGLAELSESKMASNCANPASAVLCAELKIHKV